MEQIPVATATINIVYPFGMTQCAMKKETWHIDKEKSEVMPGDSTSFRAR